MITPNILGIIIGGLLPALFFGLSSIFAKSSNSAGIGTALYVMLLGVAVLFAGGILYVYMPDKTISCRSAVHALLSGLVWAIGAALVAVALTRYHMPVSKLAPLYNMNTLVAAGLGLWIFAEWQQVHALKLLLGAVLIVIGGIIVSDT